MQRVKDLRMRVFRSTNTSNWIFSLEYCHFAMVLIGRIDHNEEFRRMCQEVVSSTCGSLRSHNPTKILDYDCTEKEAYICLDKSCEKFLELSFIRSNKTLTLNHSITFPYRERSSNQKVDLLILLLGKFLSSRLK